ncbi:MAG: ATP-binding protein [Lachnospiraceae bacterium]|nr:ATP-binding protein [Lachnospiraceae bacterium]
MSEENKDMNIASLLKEAYRAGDKISVTLKSGKEFSGEIQAFQEAFLMLKVGEELRPVAYDLIGYYEKPMPSSFRKNLPSRADEKIHYGLVTQYNSERAFGVIQVTDVKKTVTFLLSAVKDPELRRQIQENGTGYSVRFQFAELPNKKLAAVRIYAMTEEEKGELEKSFRSDIGEEKNCKELYARAKRMFQTGKKEDEEAYRIYRQLLKAGWQMDQVVADMVSICLRAEDAAKSERLSDAEKLLHKYGYLLPAEKRDVMLVQIYEKMGMPQKVLEVIETILSSNVKINSKLHYMLRKATIYNESLANRTKALEVYEEWLRLKKEHERELSANKAGYVNLMNTEKRVVAVAAQTLAGLREADVSCTPSDILLRYINENEEAVKIYREGRKSGDVSTGFDWQDVTKMLSPLMDWRLRECKLSEEVDIRLLNKDGSYLGETDEAIKETARLVQKTISQKPYERFRCYLSAARVLYDALQKDSVRNMTVENRLGVEKRFLNYMAKSLVSAGDSAAIDKNVHSDVMRFYYTESLRYVSREEQDLPNALVRNIYSFFRPKEEISVAITGNNLNIQRDLGQCVRRQHCQDLASLVNEILYILDTALERSYIAKQLAECIFDSDSELMAGLFEAFQHVNHYEVTRPCANANFFYRVMNWAVENYRKEKQVFLEAMEELKGFRYEPLWITRAMEAMERAHVFVPYLPELDAKRFQILREILNTAKRFHEIPDYERKEKALSDNQQSIQSLAESIEQQPARFSFEVFLPLLENFNGQTKNRLSKLYYGAPPQIECQIIGRENIQKAGNGIVYVQLYVTNAPNRQAADLVTAEVLNRGDFRQVKEEAPCTYLKGDSGQAMRLCLQLSEDAAPIFPLEVAVPYQYRIGLEETRIERKVFHFSVSLNETEFSRIGNPYQVYAFGARVEDERMFFGRKAFIDDIVNLICPKEGGLLKRKSIALYGQKRTGKSSILYHLEARIRDTSPDTIVVNIGEISKHMAESLGSYLYRDIFRMMAKELRRRHGELLKEMEVHGIELPDYRQITGESPIFAQEIFNDFFLDFSPFLKNRPGGRDYNVVLLIDEFTHIFTWIQKKKLDEDFMKFWKAIINDYGIVGIVIGQDFMPTFVDAFPNPFGAIEQKQVTYLPESESRRMITEAPVADGEARALYEGPAGERAIRRILELTAGSAFFNMILLNYLVEYLNEIKQSYVTDADINNLLTEKLLGGANALKLSHFESLFWDDGDVEDVRRPRHNGIVLYLISRSIYQTGSCRRQDILVPAEIRETEALDGARVDEILNKLLSRGVLIRDNNGVYRIRVGLLYEWMVQIGSMETVLGIKEL